ncbi:D-tyrosyl-tRNA(Tyr) deacylase [candidate division TA06 bacterium]|nr:D-tyrosyl-tRNA(Tyr) deacylase [candidate division TA06 bacterium]
MRAVLQRVRRAEVSVNGGRIGKIGKGMVIFLGMKEGDGEEEAQWLADKCMNLRIFDDSEGRMNRSALEVEGQFLVVSQFTLYGDARKGRRPDFTQSMEPEGAKRLYNTFLNTLKKSGLTVETGAFGEKMAVDLMNDGPVTLIIDR